MINAFRRFLDRWQEPLLWLPIAVAMLITALYVIPAIDPRAGIDGLGALFGMITVAVAVVFASFFTWLIRTTYWYDLTDERERELIEHAIGMDRDTQGQRAGSGPGCWRAVAILALDKAAFLAVFWLLLHAFVG